MAKSSKKLRHYEVTDKATGHRLGIVKASSPKHAANKLPTVFGESGTRRVYPVKLTKTRSSGGLF